MTDHSKLAAPELAQIDVTGFNRASFMIRGAITAGAVYGGSVVSPFVSRAIAQEGGGDVDILNFALTLEYLEAAFYDQAGKEVQGLSGDAKKLAAEFQSNEQEHVDALTATIKDLGGEPVKAPGVDFGKAFSDEKSFLKTAQTFEDLGVSAYNGAAPMIKSGDVLGAAGSIVQVEARHAGLVRLIRGQNPSPNAFDKTLSKEEVLEAAGPFIKK